MLIGITIAATVALILWYALSGRAWLKSKTWASKFFAWVEPAERILFKKSETILIGRLLWLGSLIVTFYDGIAVFASSLDLTPVTTRVFDALHVPADMRSVAVSAFIGLIGVTMSWLRKRVSKPIELVAVADKDVTPRVAEAIAMADSTKVEAVAVVAAAKAA